MAHGFPADEVRPYSCLPYGPQYTSKDDIHLDTLGNVSLTLLDNLDTLLIMQDWGRLETALAYLSDNKAHYFNQNHLVQVFEASIRWLGGLLSTHLALTEIVYENPKYLEMVHQYDGFLLEMAYDLGLRLIPAYRTSTHLPLPRINLASGLKGTTKHSLQGCTAGATTPFLEFTLLLRLTGDDVFEQLTKKSLYKVWDARLPLGLLPMTFDAVKNLWKDSISGIGALIDSFYEHALKGAILFNDDTLMSMFHLSYRALLSHLAKTASGDGYAFFQNIDLLTGQVANLWIDLLSAFWPGVQVLAGRLSDAVRSHLLFLKIWNVYDGLPERWNYDYFATASDTDSQDLYTSRANNAVALEWYPLRPEFIESTYYLYRATREPLYLQIGVRFLELLEQKFKGPCGFGGYQDVRTGELQDRMETFVLGELLKYLYLLFDESNESYVHAPKMKSKNWIFSTEAHPLWYEEKYAQKSRQKFRNKLRQFCLAEDRANNKNHKKSMWRGFKIQANALGPGEEAEESETAREFPQLRPIAEEYKWCELAPSQWQGEPAKFVESAFYAMGQIFLPEKDFNLTLVRPRHMGHLQAIELTPSFTKSFGLNHGYASTICSTTKRTELLIGALSRPEAYEAYTVREDVKQTGFQQGDIVMPRLSGRLKLEHLTADSIDREKNLVTYQMLRNLSGSEVVHGEVLRVYEINGKDIGNSMVWTERESLDELQGALNIETDGRVSINDEVVANLRAY